MNKSLREPLPAEVTIQTGLFDQDAWDRILDRFDDASIYQTRAYAQVRWGLENTLHFIVEHTGQPIGAVQFRVVRLPLSAKKIAYSYWGPMWRTTGFGAEHERNVRLIARAIVEELVDRRGWYVRIKPGFAASPQSGGARLFTEEGFTHDKNVEPYRTFQIDATKPLDVLLKEAKKNWRNHLRGAERNNLSIEERMDEESFALFLKLFGEMHSRKQFTINVDIDAFRRMQLLLSPHQRLRVFICRHGETPVSAMVWTAIGSRGIPLFSATVGEGLKLNSAYLLRWRLLERLQEMKCTILDQGGVHKERNPGSYSFKSGMGGTEAEHIGQFNACRNPLLQGIVATFDGSKRIKSIFKKKAASRD